MAETPRVLSLGGIWKTWELPIGLTTGKASEIAIIVKVWSNQYRVIAERNYIPSELECWRSFPTACSMFLSHRDPGSRLPQK